MQIFLRIMTAAAVAAAMAPAFAADATYNVDVVVIGAGAAEVSQYPVNQDDPVDKLLNSLLHRVKMV